MWRTQFYSSLLLISSFFCGFKNSTSPFRLHRSPCTALPTAEGAWLDRALRLLHWASHISTWCCQRRALLDSTLLCWHLSPDTQVNIGYSGLRCLGWSEARHQFGQWMIAWQWLQRLWLLMGSRACHSSASSWLDLFQHRITDWVRNLVFSSHQFSPSMGFLINPYSLIGYNGYTAWSIPIHNSVAAVGLCMWTSGPC